MNPRTHAVRLGLRTRPDGVLADMRSTQDQGYYVFTA